MLVLDEPANGLDPEGIQWLRGFLRHLAHEEGRTVLVSSHLLSEVEQTVDRVVIVGAGRLVREGTIEQLRSGAEGAGSVLVRSPEASRLADVLRAAGTPVTEDGEGAVTVTGCTPADVGRRAFAAGIQLHELRSRTSGLEEIYFRLTAGQEQFAARPPGRPPPSGVPGDPAGACGVDQLFTTRVWLGLLLGACLMVGAFSALLTGFAGDQPGDGGPPCRRWAPHCSSRWPSPCRPRPRCSS